MKKSNITKVATVMAAILLAGCATQRGAPIVDTASNVYGPDGARGLGSQGKTFTSEQLKSMINDPGSYTSAQRAEIMQKLNKLPMRVYFAFDSFYLKKDYRDQLDKASQFLVEYPRQIVRIEGHTDPRGSESYNLNLGQKRADSVKDFLLKKGVAANQICTVSYGELRPAASPSDFGGNWKKAYDLDRRAVLVYGKSCKGVR